MEDNKNKFTFIGSSASFFCNTLSAREQTFNKFGYQGERLYKARLEQAKAFSDEKVKLRLFQFFADYQYNLYANASFYPKNKNIVLMCTKAGGNGDVAHTFEFARFISEQLPGYPIKIVIDCPLYDGEKVKAIFPVNRFNIQFLSGDYYIKQKELEQLLNEAACLLGIAVPIASPVLKSPGYRTLREYGYGNHADCKGHNLSMGLATNEEGLNFPSIKHTNLHELKTDWLKEALTVNCPDDENRYHHERHLYHMYIPIWTLQVIALYSIAAIERQSSFAIDILLPLNASLAQLIEWKALNLNYLKENGIGKIVRFVENQSEEVIEIGEGKLMQILSGAIMQSDMQIVEEYSQDFFGCTGDMSLSAAFTWKKLAFYADPGLKANLLKSWKEIISKSGNLDQLERFYAVLDEQAKEEVSIYAMLTPKKKSFYQPDPSMDILEASSIPRQSIPFLAPKLENYANEIAELYLDGRILQQNQKISDYIVKHFNVKSHFMGMVYRALIFKECPELADIEKQLWDQFKAGTMVEEVVVEKLSVAIEDALSNAQALNQGSFYM